MVSRAPHITDWELLSCCLICGSEKIDVADAEYNISHCNACGFTFDNPRPTLGSIVAHYSRPGKYHSWLAHESARESLWRRRLKKLLKWANHGDLLDVGAGIGQFLDLARPFFSQVAGTEVSQSAVDTAKEKYNLDLARGTIDECGLPGDNFDLITLFHVLEHVPDPRRTIEFCRDLLRPGGTLVVCVPNDVLAWTSKIKVLGKRLGLGPFQKFSPKFGLPRVFTSNEIHLSHFTPAVLKYCFEQSKMVIVDESLDPYYAATGLRLAIHSAYYAVHRMLFWTFGVNRYDTIWMVARKAAP